MTCSDCMIPACPHIFCNIFCHSQQKKDDVYEVNDGELREEGCCMGGYEGLDSFVCLTCLLSGQFTEEQETRQEMGILNS